VLCSRALLRFGFFFFGQPLPADVTKWTAPDVQRWLKANRLDDFRKPCYANGIEGVALLELSGARFPPTRYSKERCAALDAALAVLRAKHRPGASLRQSMSRQASDDSDMDF
jgi:hypothetical protein